MLALSKVEKRDFLELLLLLLLEGGAKVQVTHAAAGGAVKTCFGQKFFMHGQVEGFFGVVDDRYPNYTVSPALNSWPIWEEQLSSS